MALPDPEMRKFLAKGSAASVQSALSAHVGLGLEIVDIDEQSFHLRLNKREYIGQTGQMLKQTVFAANQMFEEIP